MLLFNLVTSLHILMCLFCLLIHIFISVQENFGLDNHVLSEADSFKQEQSNINKLEKQAEDFLNVVFYRKGKKKINMKNNSTTYVSSNNENAGFRLIQQC